MAFFFSLQKELHFLSLYQSVSHQSKISGGWGGGTHSEPRHPIFYFISDLKDSEKLGVTFRAHVFLLENQKKVLRNHNFLEKIRNFVFAHGAG